MKRRANPAAENRVVLAFAALHHSCIAGCITRMEVAFAIERSIEGKRNSAMKNLRSKLLWQQE